MNIVKKISVMLMMVLLVVEMALPAFASTTTTAAPEQTQVQEEQEDSTDGLKAIAAGMAIGLAAAGGAIAMGIVGGKAAEGISRQPDIESKIRTTLMRDLGVIATAISYALLGGILLIFVLSRRVQYEYSVEYRLAADSAASFQLYHPGGRTLSAALSPGQGVHSEARRLLSGHQRPG